MEKSIMDRVFSIASAASIPAMAITGGSEKNNGQEDHGKCFDWKKLAAGYNWKKWLDYDWTQWVNKDYSEFWPKQQ